jgi:RNA polymerase-binding transcription factor DksA
MRRRPSPVPHSREVSAKEMVRACDFAFRSLLRFVLLDGPASNDGAREFEDDAQKLTTLELEGNLAAADDDRLSNIERALQKIADGTYGLSEGSGAPISVERLEASPEALYTLDEQKSRDVAR